MTYAELREYALEGLEKSGSDSPENDVRELMQHYFSLTRAEYSLKRNETPPKALEGAFLSAVDRRCEGQPLQYIIGSWSFMGCELLVGEGVLIPRDDTEVCVRGCMELLENSARTKPHIIDLCSGSGAIAIALASEYPDAEITAAELSDRTYDFLSRNISLNGLQNVHPVKGDISELCSGFEDGFFDAVISNPPYIRTDEIQTLQREVQYEPVMALDGGSDGLYFYRLIAEKWLQKLKPGGILSLEIGEYQARDVCLLLEEHGMEKINVLKDISGLDRAVTASRSRNVQ